MVLRVTLILLLFTLIYLLRNESLFIISLVTLLILITFISIVVYNNKLLQKRQWHTSICQLCKDELNALNYNFSAFDGRLDLVTPDHPYSLDLDIFGNKSLFQSINRTVLPSGSNCLAEAFLKPLEKEQTIKQRQVAIQEMSENLEIRQSFFVTGFLALKKSHDINDLMKSADISMTSLDSPLWRFAIWLVPTAWGILIGLTITDIISMYLATIFFPISFLIANIKVKQINKLHNKVNKMNEVFAAYAELFKIAEESDLKAEIFQSIRHRLTSHNLSASKVISKLSKLLGALDQRSNMVMVLLNIFILWDLRVALGVVKWQKEHRVNIKAWFDALAEFDMLSSMAGFAYNHPEYIYPTIDNHYFRLSGSKVGHPLMDRRKCVTNAIEFHKSPFFMIITGANMAGKSTYLRTVGVNYLLANMGLPVFAKTFSFFPGKLYTSLRTSDSLVNNESYFFAELKRIKNIIDQLRSDEKLFIILDEILKGTNSTDKQKGSKALIKQFVLNGACGIIATHDLHLGELQPEFPDSIQNFCFEADIKEDQLSFSYKLKEGIAENMNACFLMEKMGIIL